MHRPKVLKQAYTVVGEASAAEGAAQLTFFSDRGVEDCVISISGVQSTAWQGIAARGGLTCRTVKTLPLCALPTRLFLLHSSGGTGVSQATLESANLSVKHNNCIGVEGCLAC